MLKEAKLLPALLVVAGCAQEASSSSGVPPADDAAVAVAASAIEGEARHPIVVAMTAAPGAIAAEAAVADFDEGGALVELRAGTNGWTCMPDENPNAQGDSPICADAQGQELLRALLAREVPSITGLGVSYRLQGGPVASATDPFAAAPAEGEAWIQDGPHLMIVVPDARMLEGFPTDPAGGGPWVIWKGTPYAHLRIPTGAR